jgi:hypothetical protein
MSTKSLILALALFACDGGSKDPDGGAPPTNGDVTWCQALGVLEDSCQRCHQEPPQNGAPFALMTYADTQAPYYTTDFAVWEKMGAAVAADFMPATFIELDPPVEPLSCEQKTTLLTWLEQGAQLVGGEDCRQADKNLLECGPTNVAGAGGSR